MRQEVQQLIEDGEEALEEWLRRRPAAVRQTFAMVLLNLLRRLDYPDMDGIADDLTNGFDMVGKVRPGPGWRKRTDPEHIDEVCRRNRQYVHSRLQRPTPSKYAEQLLVDEQRLGRVVGPLRAPADWPCNTVPLPNISGCDVLLDPPADQFLAVASFPIVQEE